MVPPNQNNNLASVKTLLTTSAWFIIFKRIGKIKALRRNDHPIKLNGEKLALAP